MMFLDPRYHMYSHGLFHSESDSLEQASENKLQYMYESLELKPGMRLLEIGGGWGGVVDYAGSRGVQVTTLTLSQDTYEQIQQLIREKDLPCTVYLADFLKYQPEGPFDALINFGVIEHIPQYRTFFERVWDCLKPGGLFYLDGSATKEKYDKCDFVTRHIWPGTHTFMCLQNVIQELLFNGLDLLRVHNESRDYELTMWHWARNLDAHREEIEQKWGLELYRAFRLFLWGGYHAFRSDSLQAYHVLARRGYDKGPRPGRFKRGISMIREMNG